jgi:formamidopyrimidine-DNA glycosylase
MPELPEVESITRSLHSLLKGKSFQSIEIYSQRSFIGDKKQILGKTIKRISRRGKLIIFKLEGSVCLVIHLKMTGQFIYQFKGRDKKERSVVGGHPDEAYRRQSELPHKYTRVTFTLNDDSKLFFNDLRLFGWAKTVKEEKLAYELKKIGNDALSLRIKEFRSLIQRYPRRKIKEFLQDQELIAGIGNIYASEILFCAEVLPDRKAGGLKEEEIKRLFSCIRQILKEAIRLGGTSVSDYRKPDGSRGGYLDQALVYQREGEKCRKCGGKIRRQKIGQRSVFYCPVCQR